MSPAAVTPPHPLLPPSLQVLERGWLSSNNIVFADDDVPAVVDTGYVTHGQATLDLVEQALRGRRLGRILNTHLHSDHAGGNALLQARHGCEVWIPPGDADLVDAWDEDRLSYRRTGQQCPRFAYDALLQPHGVVSLGGEDWTVLPARGHDHAMVMLWCERLGILMSADALWQKGFGVIFPELAGVSGFAEQAATLELIGQLQPRVVIPGHGAPFGEHDGAVSAALEAARARIRGWQEAPRRHADHAMKVLLAFKLLEARRMTLAELQALVQASLAGNTALRGLYPDDTEAMAAFLAQELVRSRAATLEDGVLVAPQG
ncbi:MAG: MBL fold metallo-hydrolase [Proteobacteria bacterium]|uniref:MBL fold metallo-hydrolase n=1 Tax=Aquabacterium sp. TaxID=1872578 RepID=UPI0035C70B39|nr:MBL fold metallo-hydrolase [Pseudomonadota bacterium]